VNGVTFTVGKIRVVSYSSLVTIKYVQGSKVITAILEGPFIHLLIVKSSDH